MSKRPKKYDTEQPRDVLRLGGLKRVTTRALVVLGPIQEVHSDFPRFFALPSAAVYVLGHYHELDDCCCCEFPLGKRNFCQGCCCCFKRQRWMMVSATATLVWTHKILQFQLVYVQSHSFRRIQAADCKKTQENGALN
mgnify:CR=1 FL=1